MFTFGSPQSRISQIDGRLSRIRIQVESGVDDATLSKLTKEVGELKTQRLGFESQLKKNSAESPYSANFAPDKKE